MKNIYKIIFLFLLTPLLIFANNASKGKHTKTKIIKREFSVNLNATVDLDNKYGSIDIQTWDQNIVTLEIIITTKSSNESKAQNKLDDIYIDFENSKTRVFAKTKIEKPNSWNWGNSNNISMDIQYIVRIPKSNNLIVDMDYGDVMIDELYGKSDINIDYGRLIAGELSNTTNNINLDYSTGTTIEFLKKGNINADYSTISIEKTGNINLNADYSTITIDNGSSVKYDLDYGNLTIDYAGSIIGTSDYTSLDFGTISDYMSVNADYGNLKIREMGPNFTSVDIETEYISVKIGVNSNSSFELEIHTQYGSVKVPSKLDVTNRLIKNSRTELKGTYNGNKGKMIINTQYGSVKIIEN